MDYVAVAAGAVLGANLRYVVVGWAADRWGADFPYGTMIVNITGAFVIGIILAFLSARLSIDPVWRLFFVTGFLGGYTTFSSFAWESLALIERGDLLQAGAYFVGTNAIGMLGVWVGALLARLISS